jgi:hypothetical protein
VRQILIGSGFKYNRPSSKIDTVKSQDVTLSSYLYIKRKAFTYGVSVLDYLNLKNKLGKVIFGLLKHKMYRIETNKDKVKLLKKSGGEEQVLGLYLQMSMLDVLEVYLEDAVKNYPEINNREALLKVLKDGRSFMLSRKDLSKPYTKNNVQVLSKKDHGVMVGKMFGTYSEYQMARK